MPFDGIEPGEGEKRRGFTLVELMAAVAILLLLTSLALPVARMQVQRQKETDLRRSLRTMREATGCPPLTNLQEEDIQRLRASLGPQELQLLRLFGFDPNNMSNQQILQLVKGLTQNQFQTIEQMGLDPKALRVSDLRRLLFSVPTPQ